MLEVSADLTVLGLLITGTAGDGCSIAASLQWRYPFASTFIRDFAPRLARAAETHFCFEHWAPFISGDVDGVRTGTHARNSSSSV